MHAFARALLRAQRLSCIFYSQKRYKRREQLNRTTTVRYKMHGTI